MIRYLVSIFTISCWILTNFCYFSTSKIIDFCGTVVIFKGFAVSTCNVNFVMFLWSLGASWGPLGPLLGGLWRPFGVSWGRFGGGLGASL